MFKGVYTAIVTPFKNNNFDIKSYEKIVKEQIDSGVSGIVPTGTTGESATLSHEEHLQVIKSTVNIAKNRVQIIAGTGSNSTSEAISMTQEAEKMGVSAALIVSPYYNKPSQEGLFQHFKSIADSVKIPIMLYNIPGRTCVSIEIDTIKKLVESCSNIRSIKEAGGDVNRVIKMKQILPEDFVILSGDDPKTIEFMDAGALGVVSVVSNLIPSEISQMVQHYLNNEVNQAKNIANKYSDLFNAMLNLATNPIPIKSALYIKNKLDQEFRLPMTPLNSDDLQKLRKILESANI